MKVAVISDIHGNFQALKSVLDDMAKFGCEKILCLGDLAMAGPEPGVIINYVQEQDGWEIIQGNTDKMIAEYSTELFEQVYSTFPVMANALADDVKILSETQKNFLKNLPQQKEIDICGVKVLMVHGSPRKNNEDILPDFPIEKVEEIISGTDADLIFCGHTHISCGYQTNKKQTVVNVGSVGRPMHGEPKACYVIANFENGTFSIEHRFVDYDKETAAGIVSQRGFDGCLKLASMILDPKDRHI